MKISVRKLTAAMLAAAGLAGSVAAVAVESKDPIKLTIHDWTGQYITTHIMGAVLDEMGYNVEYVQADYIAQFAGLEAGDLHVAMEMWETTGKDAMEASLATGKTVDLGETGMVAIEEWWYPDVHEGGVPWAARLECAQRVHGSVRHAGDPSEGTLSRRSGHLGRLRRRARRRTRPRLRGRARRHRCGAVRRARIRDSAKGTDPALDLYAALGAHQVRGRVGRFPRYTDECYKDPKWGMNPDKAYDCGKPRGWIKKVGWKGGEEKWPNAYQAVRNFQITNQEMGEMVGRVDLEGKSVDEVVAAWMAENKDNWMAWTK